MLGHFFVTVHTIVFHLYWTVSFWYVSLNLSEKHGLLLTHLFHSPWHGQEQLQWSNSFQLSSTHKQNCECRCLIVEYQSFYSTYQHVTVYWQRVTESSTTKRVKNTIMYLKMYPFLLVCSSTVGSIMVQISTVRSPTSQLHTVIAD